MLVRRRVVQPLGGPLLERGAPEPHLLHLVRQRQRLQRLQLLLLRLLLLPHLLLRLLLLRRLLLRRNSGDLPREEHLHRRLKLAIRHAQRREALVHPVLREHLEQLLQRLQAPRDISRPRHRTPQSCAGRGAAPCRGTRNRYSTGAACPISTG